MINRSAIPTASSETELKGQRSALASKGQGAYCSLDHLIALRHSAKDLKLTTKRRALSSLAGPNRTNFRGRGIDFEEVRQYQPGDDIRSIDWRVTARSGKPHTKLFREERERPTLLIIDQRANMFFGSRCCFKSVLAAQIGALLAWSALASGDRVGGLVFNDHQHQEIRPKRSRHSVLQLLSLTNQYNRELNKEQINASHSVRLADIAGDLMRIAKPGSAVYFVSDLDGFDEDTEKLFYHISRHNDVTCLLPYDLMESELPRDGYYNFSNGEQRFGLYTGESKLRQRYHSKFTEHLEQLQHKLGRLGISLIPIATHDSPLTTLQRYFGPIVR
jgi:uncharacterized protein (DUF58 family)